MGADMISIGWTERASRPTMTKGEVEEMLRESIVSVRECILNADYGDYMEFHFEQPVEWDDTGVTYESAVRGGLVDDFIVDALVAGIDELDSSPRSVATYSIGGTNERVFLLRGGMTWGDDPFGGYSEACLALDILDCDVMGDIRERLGVYGSGIRPQETRDGVVEPGQ